MQGMLVSAQQQRPSRVSVGTQVPQQAERHDGDTSGGLLGFRCAHGSLELLPARCLAGCAQQRALRRCGHAQAACRGAQNCALSADLV